MIAFVNAKINLGLNIVARRADGYHNLQTVFLPVGLHSGTPRNPEPFCDILEITPAEKNSFTLTGNAVDCPLEKNLIWKAYQAFPARTGEYAVSLDKHLPDGAGMGGGSADAAFVLTMLNKLEGNPLTDDELEQIAVKLGADCPVFIKNLPAYAEGVGEKLEPLSLNLEGYWLAVVKPDLRISTREAFAGITPCKPLTNLRDDIQRPVAEWPRLLKNDFEESLFPRYPELAELKARLYEEGAEFALMTGSGASLYGLYPSRDAAAQALDRITAPYRALLAL